ncbi:MAG TPA: DUF805 domain-containing protein [Gammaproteobacteria bacterium]|nr:DUF805 domain-containing protein [Gammaproteobacteria bacterium]
MNFDTLFVFPKGRTSRGEYIGALITLLAVFALYYFEVRSRNGQWCRVVLIYPAIVLHARRLHDMGRSAWPLLAPAALLVATAWLYLFVPMSQAKGTVAAAELVVCVGFVVWALLGKGQAEANRFGKPAVLVSDRAGALRGAASHSSHPREEETRPEEI